ncbi:amidohydrolase family protein [Variovorax paradoxus]|uniref:amidohydrolase family protein n=1 Tax=Variovorax paradoxus TaxID=34073 RepID=UPI00325AC402
MDARGRFHKLRLSLNNRRWHFVSNLPLAPQRRHAPDYDATPAEYLGLLDAHGISHALLVQPGFLGADNSFMLRALRACPDRLRGVAVVHPERPLPNCARLPRLASAASGSTSWACPCPISRGVGD